MKVLHVLATGNRRGAEIFASDLAGALAALGVDQRAAIIHGSSSDVDLGVPVTMLEARRGLPVVHLHTGGLLRLQSVIRSWRPDVVQAHGGEALKYSAVAAGRRPKIAYRRIGEVGYWLGSGLRRGAHELLIRRADVLVAVAETLRNEMAETFRIPADRIAVIPNGVDAERVRYPGSRSAARAEIGIALEGPAILAMGALTDEKDPLAALQAMRAALSRVPDALGLFAGDGPLRPELETAVARSGLDGRVHVLGNRTDVAALLAASDVLLLASRTEGMPGCVIEAGMAQLPVVAYDVGGVGEVVAHGRTGLLAPPDDLERLASDLSAVLADPLGRRVMGRRAGNLCRSRFRIDVVARSYLDVYEELGACRSGRRRAPRAEPERFGAGSVRDDPQAQTARLRHDPLEDPSEEPASTA